MISAEVKRVVVDCAKEFDVGALWLFGSSLGDQSVARDIDLAVEGLSKERFFEAYGTLSWSSPYDVDLKPIENLTPLIQARVREGSVLYEARESS